MDDFALSFDLGGCFWGLSTNGRDFFVGPSWANEAYTEGGERGLEYLNLDIVEERDGALCERDEEDMRPDVLDVDTAFDLG